MGWRVALAGVLAAASPVAGQDAAGAPVRVETVDLAHQFGGVDDATAVVLDGRRGRVVRYRPERASVRFAPASTFKIVSTVVALETGVVDGPGFALPFDSAARRDGFFPRSWARDHTLRSAFRHSVVWFYRRLARRIGEPRMSRFLRRFDYGNAVVGAIDEFWLNGELRISADEQVRFLYRLLNGEHGVSSGTVAVLRELALLAKGEGWRLYGKTGTSEVTATRENGWIVGWVEGDVGASWFAINMEGERVWEEWPPQRRHQLALRVLRDVGSLPDG